MAVNLSGISSGQTFFREYRANNPQFDIPAWGSLSKGLQELWASDPAHAQYATWRFYATHESAPGWGKLSQTQQQSWEPIALGGTGLTLGEASNEILYNQFKARNPNYNLPDWANLGTPLQNLWGVDPSRGAYATYRTDVDPSAGIWSTLSAAQRAQWAPQEAATETQNTQSTTTSGTTGTGITGGAGGLLGGGNQPFETLPPNTGMTNPDTTPASPGFFSTLWSSYSVEIIVGIGVLILAWYGYRHGWGKKIKAAV